MFLQSLLINTTTTNMGLNNLFYGKKESDSLAITPQIGSRSISLSLINSRSETISELEQVFKRFDVNGDGKISASELGSIMHSLGQPATEEELRSMIGEVDADADGHVDLKEFIELNTKGIDSNEILKNLKEAFSVFDIDGNGSITAEELCTVLKGLGDECSVADCRRMINGVDSDGNGVIDFEEFKIMMMTGSRNDLMDRKHVTAGE